MWWKCRKICSFVCWECYLLQRNSCLTDKIFRYFWKIWWFGQLTLKSSPWKKIFMVPDFLGFELEIFDNPDFFRVATWRFFLIYGNPSFFRLPHWKKSGLSEHDVLWFETNLDISNQNTRCRLKPCTFGLRKWLDPVVVIFFKNAKKVLSDPVVVNFFEMHFIQHL